MNTLKPFLAKIGRGESLTAEDAAAAIGVIMDGEATSAQIGGLLLGMQARGVTVPELTGAVTAMRARMTPVEAPADAIDVCGTGGDGAATLNISTANAFVVAACGVPVAKHGNRAISSRAGGADVLAALGVNIEPPLDSLKLILREAGCVFMLAPRHHPALRHAAAARIELGTRTIFNLTGPMVNPARVTRQFMGVFDPVWARPVAETLAALGTKSAWIVHGGGLDELTLDGGNHVVALDRGRITEVTLTAADAGLPAAPIAAIAGGDGAYNGAALLAMLEGEPGPYRDTVLFNAAAALIVAGRCTSLVEGVALAADAIDSRRARAVLETLKNASRALQPA